MDSEFEKYVIKIWKNSLAGINFLVVSLFTSLLR